MSGPDPDRNVWGGGGGDTYIIDYTMELPFMNKYTFTAGGGGGGEEKTGHKRDGRRDRSV